MRTLAIALTLTAAPVAALAQGLSFEGATLGLNYNNNNTFDYTVTELEGSVELGFGPGFSLQADLATWDYSETDSEQYNSFGLHAIYDLGADTSVGAFFTRESWNDDTYDFIGLEAKHVFAADSARPLTVEAYIGEYSEQNGGYGLRAGSIDVDWALGSGFSLNGGLRRSTVEDEVTTVQIGAGYELAQGPRVDLALQRQTFTADDFEQDVVSLTLAYDLKGGVTFKQRKWVDLLPAY